MIYGFRTIDLKRKYFGDILSEDVINKKTKKTKKKQDEIVKNALKEIKKNNRRYKNAKNNRRIGCTEEEVQCEYSIFME